MEHLMLITDNSQELERRVEALEKEVETLRDILNDLLKPDQQAPVPSDQSTTHPDDVDDDGDWYSEHGHGD